MIDHTLLTAQGKLTMKKFILIASIITIAMSFANVAQASGGHHRGHGHHHRYHEAEYYQPAPYYAPPPPVHYDRRSHQGLAGGVVGSVLGYEIGNGHPLATGLGAAAGSFLGNEVSGRR
jgi:opacity protein-like surface antigen